MYGEKADIRPLLGEGIKGDCTAIMMMRNGGAEFIESCSTACRSVAVRARNGQVFVDGEGLQSYVCTMQLSAGGHPGGGGQVYENTMIDGRVSVPIVISSCGINWIKISREVP